MLFSGAAGGAARGREMLCRCFGRSGGVPTADLHHSQHGCDLLQKGHGVVRQLLPGSLAFTQRLFFNKKRVRSQWPEQPAGSARAAP